MHVFLVRFSRRFQIKNILNTLHNNIIYDERDIWMNKMFILAVAFIIDNILTSLFCCSGYICCGYVIKLTWQPYVVHSKKSYYLSKVTYFLSCRLEVQRL